MKTRDKTTRSPVRARASTVRTLIVVLLAAAVIGHLVVPWWGSLIVVVLGGGWALTRLPRIAPEPIRVTTRQEALGAIAQLHPSSDDALVVIGLQNLDEIEDLNGFNFGHSVLERLLDRLSEVAPSESVSAIVGHDQIMVFLRGRHAADGPSVVVHEMKRQIPNPLLVEGRKVVVRVRFGFSRIDTDDLELAYRRAHLALQQTAETNEACVEYHEPLAFNLQRRVSLQEQVQEAFEQDRMVFHGQPIVAVGSHAPFALELLVRMEQADGSLVSPADFLPECETLGLLDELGRRALTTAGSLLNRWNRDAALSTVGVNVNIAPQHIRRNLVNDVLRVTRTLENPGRLSLEFVENELIDHRSTELAHLHRLTAAGVKLVLDDFGKGYSSLSYLETLPITTVKFDGSFVRSFDQRNDASALLPGLIRLVQAMGFRHTIEGVETDTMLRSVASIGAESVQGYVISRPQPFPLCEQTLRGLSSTASIRQVA